MPFRIPRAVLALAVWLIDRLRIDARTGRARPLVVGIDIVDIDEETRMRDVRRLRRIELMFRRRSVEPNRSVTGADLAVDGITIRVSIHASTIEAECLDQEIVGGRDVAVGQNRNDALETRH